MNSKDKGYRTENKAKQILAQHTGLNWQRVPASGALSAEHGLKGDLYVAGAKNLYCIEVKGYKDDKITTKILTDKSSQLSEWWNQAVRQGNQVQKRPFLIFKHDRSKFFAALYTEDLVFTSKSNDIKSIVIPFLHIVIVKLEDLLQQTDFKFIE